MTIHSHTKPMTLEERVATLEHERRMTKRMCQVTMILLLCVGGALVGTTISVPAIGTEDGDLGRDLPIGQFSSITTRELQVEDEAGHMRAILSTEKGIHGGNLVVLNMLDSTGKNVLSLQSGGPFGPSLHISSAGVGSVAIAVTGQTPTIQILDAQGEAGALLWFMNGSPHLVMNDQKGKIRAMIGYEGVGKGRKGKPSTMAIYDTEGKVLWSAIENQNEIK